MVWLFARGEQAIRLETRYDRVTADYVLVQHQRDGGEKVERFKDSAAFRVRLEEVETQLETERWVRSGPFLLRDGWRL